MGSAICSILRNYVVPGQNGESQNGDNPKRRQDKGNITKTATEKCGQNGDKELRTAKCFKQGCWLLVVRNQTLHFSLVGSTAERKQADFKEVTTTQLHTSGNMKWLCWFLPHDAMLAWYMPSSCVCVCVSACLSHSGIVSKWLNIGWCK